MCLLRYREEKAPALLRNLKRLDRHDDAVLPGREESARGNNCVIFAILGPEDDVPDLADDLVVRTSDLQLR